MPDASAHRLLDAQLESWDRNNTVMLNLLGALPAGGLEARAVPPTEWAVEGDPDRIARMLTESAATVREAVSGRVLAGRDLERNFGHPILLLQLLLWHEGYHHGQIKLALKLAGCPIGDEEAGPLTWDVWRRRM